MKQSSRFLGYGMIVAVLALVTFQASAQNVRATATAVRLAGTITGGSLPTSDPLFTQMVSKVSSGDVKGAALIAANSNYFAGYLARRLAFQMQNPNLSADSGIDSDATTFIVAHFVGGGGIKPSISTLWSDNSTYLVMVNGTATHAASLTPAQLMSTNWMTGITQVSGQKDARGTAIPRVHVGGYTTLSDRINDNSYAMFGATAGTNLRMIEGIWQIGTGLSLVETSSTNTPASEAPRFIPEYDPNFYHGQGQPACLSCHGGGMANIDHGYSTVADVFDFDATNGFTYIANPVAPTAASMARGGTMKSLGSDPAKRFENLRCNLQASPTPVCNPTSKNVDNTNHSWNLNPGWAGSVLNRMGWNGPTSGNGLNELGAALGKADIVYEFLAKRVANEICPTAQFTDAQLAQFAATVNPQAAPVPGSDDIRTLVATIASNAACL